MTQVSTWNVNIVYVRICALFRLCLLFSFSAKVEKKYIFNIKRDTKKSYFDLNIITVSDFLGFPG